MTTFERSMEVYKTEYVKWPVLLTPQVQQAYTALSKKTPRILLMSMKPYLSITLLIKKRITRYFGQLQQRKESCLLRK